MDIKRFSYNLLEMSPYKLIYMDYLGTIRGF